MANVRFPSPALSRASFWETLVVGTQFDFVPVPALMVTAVP